MAHIPRDEELAQLAELVRQQSTQRVQTLVESLQPYVDGSFGQINPGHVKVYLDCLRELGRLWRVYARPEPVPEVVDEVAIAAVTAEVRRAQVLVELGKLRAVGRSAG